MRRRDARDEPALQRFRPAAPRHEAVGRRGEEPRAGDQVRGAVERRARRTRSSSTVRKIAAVSPRLQLPRHSTSATGISWAAAAARCGGERLSRARHASEPDESRQGGRRAWSRRCASTTGGSAVPAAPRPKYRARIPTSVSTPGTPARLRGRLSRRQVSWLAGRRPRAAFPGFRPVAIGARLTAHSCGDSRGFGQRPHRIPS